MTLTLYNSLTRREEPFKTIEPQHVRMYCCGITTYDYCHVGHARSSVAWDVVRRYLLWRGYNVRYVQNFTDIDDKILNRAREWGTSMEAVSEQFTAAYFEDMERLNVLEADEYPRATHSLDGIQRLIRELEAKGFAYGADGDVYYRVRKFEGYGKLSNRKLEEMEAGRSGRVAEDPEAAKKEDPFDFALWKGAKPGEPAWESPWGCGRPGWHIECSAMVRDRLGETIDIHCGGADLIFPHHENEIAQSEAATGKSLANYWLHNGMVKVNGEKMSKSLGNFTTIRDLLDGKWAMYPKTVDPMALRLFILQAQYRKPLDFTPEAIDGAQNSWNTLREGLQFGDRFGQKLGWEDSQENDDLKAEYRSQFQGAMDEDVCSPGGLAVVFKLAKELQREGNVFVHEGKTDTDPAILRQQWEVLVELARVLGLEAKSEATQKTEGGLSDADIEARIADRQAARKAKNYAEGDRIRDELKAQGITLIDKPGGVTQWHRE
ncbi:MAG: cysteine--tRNA ligase [Cyanobacteriota bacterium]|nr:cysteine--tRNA ligase [Cyanobacteriota bacterium]